MKITEMLKKFQFCFKVKKIDCMLRSVKWRNMYYEKKKGHSAFFCDLFVFFILTELSFFVNPVQIVYNKSPGRKSPALFL